jgi:hypothetical protein
VAYCPRCGEAFSLSALVAGEEADTVDLESPPAGAWFQREMSGFVVGATTRSPAAFFLVPFMCFWSGFSLGGIYGSQIINGQLNPFLCLFGIPFVLGTLVFGSLAVMTVCGKIVVSVDRDEGKLFMGVGSIGWTRRFAWSSVKRVEEQPLGYRYSGQNGPALALVGDTRLKFGSMLRDARRYFMLQALRRMLAERPAKR